KMMQNLYHSFILAGTPFIETTPETAELIKYASNAFLATKVSFINQMADLCEKCHADIRQVAEGMGFDHRIGKEFLNVGPGFGGSCFSKDMKALIQTSENHGASLSIVEAALTSNEARKYKMVDFIISALGGSAKGKTIAILGLTFKASTDDLRESISLTIIPALCAAGATIKAYDPKGMENAQNFFPEINFATTAYEAIKDADALVILTEWEEFKSLDLKQIKNLLKTPLIIDLRNIFAFEEMNDHGFMYYSLGRVPLLSSKDEKVKDVAA
ncbi:MAG: UDP-glucose/GDP-mannose dehydrogenase family protein, partial [Alphaproteobacteria bacterium]|nr:UDP-glucose/GDP-mannose dehydrogenase family protein [Alphaproteobacteria bacterium]